jgi:hypothetical protein
MKSLKVPKPAKSPSKIAQAQAVAQKLFLTQQGNCQLCHKKLTNKSEAMVDYQPWDRNVVRGLLHRDCKAMLQIESPAMLRKLKNYLGVERLDYLPREQKAERQEQRK